MIGSEMAAVEVLRSEDYQTSLQCMNFLQKIPQASQPPDFWVAASAPAEPKSLRTDGLPGIFKSL